MSKFQTLNINKGKEQLFANKWPGARCVFSIAENFWQLS